MKKILLALVVLVYTGANFESIAQKAKPKTVAKKPAAKKTTTKKVVSKKKITNKPGTSPFSLSVIKENVTYTYDLKKGDSLFYEVNAGGNNYNFIVIINSFTDAKGIDINYLMTAPINKKGRVTVTAAAYKSSRKYVNYFAGGDLKLTDACAIWLCNDAYYDDLLKKNETIMTMDNSAPETFYVPEEDAVQPTIIFKGEEVLVDGMKLNNKKDGNGNHEVWVHNSSTNPLIIKMDLGFTIQLKEVR